MVEKKYEYVTRSLTWEGKRYKVRGKTEQEAADKLAELKAGLKRGEIAVGAESTVDRWFREWFDLYKRPAGLTAKSLRNYEQKYRIYIQPKIGRMKLKDVKPVHLQRVLNESAGMSKSHLTMLRLTMTEMFSRARKDHLLVWDPSEDLILPDYTVSARRSITEEERAAIMEVAKTHRAGLWVLTMLYAGLRPGETVPLIWKDVDFKQNELHIYKAAESGTGAVKGPKTPSGVRDIPIHPELRQRLLAARGGPLEPVFTNTQGGRLNETNIRRMWGTFKKAVDIYMGAKVYRNQVIESVVAHDLTPYCLRHTFCTDLQRAGVPINVAKELMGHADITVTANIYTHKDQAVLHRNMKKLSKTSGTKGGTKNEAKVENR